MMDMNNYSIVRRFKDSALEDTGYIKDRYTREDGKKVALVCRVKTGICIEMTREEMEKAPFSISGLTDKDTEIILTSSEYCHGLAMYLMAYEKIPEIALRVVKEKGLYKVYSHNELVAIQMVGSEIICKTHSEYVKEALKRGIQGEMMQEELGFYHKSLLCGFDRIEYVGYRLNNKVERELGVLVVNDMKDKKGKGQQVYSWINLQKKVAIVDMVI